jgi:protein-S-isoprenylcysteine O-methyltransferase Ste14
LVSGGVEAATAAFATAAVVIVLLLFGLSLAVATAQTEVVAALRAYAPQVKRWGGWILLGVGIWLIVLGAWAMAFAGLLPV